jgi:flagellar biosynthesis/type III secretory pathway protein FliH
MTRSNDIRPFLSTIPSSNPAPRSFVSSLASIPTTPAPSPWNPQANAPATPALVVDTAAIEAEARERGREEGLAETAQLRAQLEKAIAAFTHARAALVTPSAMKIAAAAAAVVGAWTETAAPSELYAPIVHAWIAKHDAPAIAHVAPAHADALEELIGGAPVTVVADASMRDGDIRFSSPTMELAHSWNDRLPDLRDAIANALESP